MQVKHLAAMIALAGLSATALAQSATASAQVAAPGSHYLDVKAGQSRFSTTCGRLYGCDDADTSYGVSFGHQINPNYAVELGYTNFGKAERGGGDVKAQATSLSLVARLPFDRFAVYGKAGASYGMTKSSAAFISDTPSGKAYGWGANYGVGVSYDLTPDMTVLAQWDETNLKFAGEGQEHVNGASVGLRFKF